MIPLRNWHGERVFLLMWLLQLMLIPPHLSFLLYLLPQHHRPWVSKFPLLLFNQFPLRLPIVAVQMLSVWLLDRLPRCKPKSKLVLSSDTMICLICEEEGSMDRWIDGRCKMNANVNNAMPLEACTNVCFTGFTLSQALL